MLKVSNGPPLTMQVSAHGRFLMLAEKFAGEDRAAVM